MKDTPKIAIIPDSSLFKLFLESKMATIIALSLILCAYISGFY